MKDDDASLMGLAYTMIIFARAIVDQTGVDRAATVNAVRFLAETLPGDDAGKKWTKMWSDNLADFIGNSGPPSGPPKLRLIPGGRQ